MSHFLLLLQIAFRNLFAAKVNLIVGFIMLAGTFVVIVGGAMFESLDASMSRSAIGSIAGHLQVYSAESKDELALFGGFGGGLPKMEPIKDFPRVKERLEALEDVRVVIPMGMGTSMLTSGNTIDLSLARLREKLKRQLGGDSSPALAGEIASMKAHVREMARLIRLDLINAQKITSRTVADDGWLAVVDRVLTDAFWQEFDRDPLNGMEFLENKLAQMLVDGDWLVLRYTGTDLHAFQAAFDRMEIVEGQLPPRGERGLLIPTFSYEELFKVKAARRLDLIRKAVEVDHKKIAGDPDLERRVKELPSLTRDILLQLDPLKQRAMVERLQRSLATTEANPQVLIERLFTVDDSNVIERHRIFYADVAPLLDLYRIRVGDVVSMQSQTPTGYGYSLNVKLWGTFRFKGLEESPLAGITSLIDLVSFQDLYGYLTPEKLAEIRALKARTGAKEISREDAEAALFGGGEEVVSEGAAAIIDESAELDAERAPRKTSYTEEDLRQSLALNAAVILEPGRDVEQAKARISQVNTREGLGLKVLTWQEASGFVGQITLVARLILYFAVFVIFTVAIVIINNAMMMATLQRVREIGTLRAIGTGKGFILSMVLVETAVLGAVFGLLGALLGAGFMSWLGRTGIPATSEELYFFFSGPRLFPGLSWSNVLAGLLVVLVVSLISTLYPAFLAARVQPVTAMQATEE